MEFDEMKMRLRRRENKKPTTPSPVKGVRKYTKLNCDRFVKAVHGSGGNIGIIAHRLGVKYCTVSNYLRGAPDWVQEEMRVERQTVLDVAEDAVLEMIQQRLNFPVAAKTATWVLEHHPGSEERGYKGRQIIIGGGKTPIKVQNENLISLERLKTIPLEVRKTLLEEIKQQENK